jgi:hypothetical protein
MYYSILNSQCSLQEQKTSMIPFGSPSSKLCSHCINTHFHFLDLPSFPMQSRQAHILPGLDQHSLLYVGQMCDSDCAITFTAKKVAVKHGASTILTGTRDKDSGLWRVPLGDTNSEQSVPQHVAHNVYEKTSIQDIIG